MDDVFGNRRGTNEEKSRKSFRARGLIESSKAVVIIIVIIIIIENAYEEGAESAKGGQRPEKKEKPKLSKNLIVRKVAFFEYDEYFIFMHKIFISPSCISLFSLALLLLCLPSSCVNGRRNKRFVCRSFSSQRKEVFSLLFVSNLKSKIVIPRESWEEKLTF